MPHNAKNNAFAQQPTRLAVSQALALMERLEARWLLSSVIFQDGFAGSSVSASRWRLPDPGPASFVGQTQFRVKGVGNLPAVSGGAAHLKLETYNPTGLGSFYGTDLIGPSFNLDKGVDFEFRAKLSSPIPGGIVGGLFTYGLKNGGNHDELDTEILSNWVVDNSGRVQANVYDNEPLGAGHPSQIVIPAGTLAEYHNYRIEWRSDHVSWFIDNQLKRTDSANVPSGPMELHLNIWAPASDWTNAYSAGLNAVSSKGENTTYTLDVDSVVVTAVNSAPTLTKMTNMVAPVPGNSLVITYDDLFAHSDASEPDDDFFAFQVTPLNVGTLLFNGNPITSPVNIYVDDTLTWTPPANAHGNLKPFSVRTYDFYTTSSTAIAVQFVQPPSISISANKSKASEVNGTASGMGQFTLTRSKGILAEPLDVTVTISGAGENGTDYDSVATHVHFDAGKSTAKISITPISDGIAEGTGTESVIFTIVPSDQGALYTFNPSKNSATVNIADAASTVTIKANDAAASEINGSASGMGQFTVTRSGGDLSAPLIVFFDRAGSATEVADYQSISPHTVTIPAGKTSAPILIKPFDDGTLEGPETVILTLTGDGTPSYFVGAKNLGTVTIADANHPVAAASSVLLNGALKNTPFVLTYAAFAAQSGITDPEHQVLQFKIAGTGSGTLTKNGFAVKSGATFFQGETLTWTPPADGVGVFPAFKVTASDGVTASSKAMQVNVNVTDAVTVSAFDAWAFEGNGTGSVLTATISLSVPAIKPVSVNYATTNGTAIAGTNYTARSGTLNFSTGEMTKTIQIPISSNQVAGPEKKFSITLTNPSADLLLGDSSATATIYNDDFNSIDPGTYTLTDVSSTVHISGLPALVGGIVITVNDQRVLSPLGYLHDLILTSPSGTSIRLIDRSKASLDENGKVTRLVGVTFSDASNDSIYLHGFFDDLFGGTYAPDQPFSTFNGTQLNGNWTLSAPFWTEQGESVSNTDKIEWSMSVLPSNAPLIIVSPATVTEPGPGGSANANFVFTLSQPMPSAVTVKYATSDKTAVAGAAYSARTGTVTFAPYQTSATVSVPVLYRGVIESGQDFALNLSNPIGAQLAVKSEIASITDSGIEDASLGDLAILDTFHAVGINQFDEEDEDSFLPPAYKLKISYTVKNLGSAVSPATTISFFIQTSGISYLLGSPVAVAALNPGESRSANFVLADANLALTSDQWRIRGHLNYNDRNLLNNDALDQIFADNS